MTLSAGARLGPYEIVSPIGAGGMGEVYRAKDTRLDREVAVKVLPEHLSGSEELRSRFEREAKAISSLQHPNICTLYDVGREGETDFLVMELLEGESLADRVAKGPLPIEEVLRLGIQIADALEKAHAAGIVHRDLKPGNVFLAERGIKLLDFGLAKLHAASQQTSQTKLGALPTEQLSAPLTSAGMILGTFQYMSPEQLEGKESDSRSDIFALGCVLYEMATGKKAFSGNSQASLIGAIMSSSPVPLSPPALDRVISTCLAKDPKDRWHTAHDVKLQLQWIAEGGSQIGVPAPVAMHRKNRERTAWALAAVATLAAIAFAVGWARRAPVAPELIRFEIQQPANLPLVGSPKLSPDGRYLAFDGTDEQGVTRIYVRAMNALEAQPLPGTEGTSRPFWSPDSRFLGFISGGKLKKVEVTGGPPQVVCDAPTGSDGAWGPDGTILFDGTGNDPINKVSAAGGIAAPLVDGKTQPGWPQFLPGGQRFLFVHTSAGKGQGISIAKLDGSDEHEVINGLSRVEYAPPGYLLFVRDQTLVAQRFDADAGKLVGEPIPIAEGLGTDAVGLADFSASKSGTLAYRAGRAGLLQYVWLDRKGARVGAEGDPGSIGNFDLSPDGRWLVHTLGSGGDADLWVRDLKRGVSSRFTFDEGAETTPAFSRDSRFVYFVHRKSDQPSRLVRRALDRSGAEELLLESPDDLGVNAITPDGQTLLFQRRAPEGQWALWTTPLAHPDQAKAIVESKFHNVRPAISPDGRWLAFESNESGRSEIYVVGLAGGGGRWQISTRGGAEPMWAPDGKELFYLSPESKMMHVAVTTGASFDVGTAEPLFGITYSALSIRNRYRISPDGERFLVLAPQGDAAKPPITVLLHWRQLLER
jgi:eukaryotic-like serine/threonine-protein kinase